MLTNLEGYIDPAVDGWLFDLDFGLMVELVVLVLVDAGHETTADVLEAFTSIDVDCDVWRTDWVVQVLGCLERRYQLESSRQRNRTRIKWKLTRQGRSVLATRRANYAADLAERSSDA